MSDQNPLVGARDATHLEIKISNGSREANQLLRIRTERLWTEAEVARVAELDAVNAGL